MTIIDKSIRKLLIFRGLPYDYHRYEHQKVVNILRVTL